MILVLILSITPVNAVEISENFNIVSPQSTESLISKINDEENDLKSSTDELNNHTDTIDESLDYIKANWWKFWKWGTVMDKIDQISSETQKVTQSASKLNETALKMQENSEQLQDNLKQDNITPNPSDLKDANLMINHLTQRLNLNISTSYPNNLSKGDIVQYKSQNNYYRYLKYVKTENNNVILEGSKNKVITVSQEEFRNRTNLKLTANNFNSTKIINEAYKIQDTEIRDQINDTESRQKSYEALTISGTVIGGLGSILVMAGLTVFGMALATIVFTVGTSAAGITAAAQISVVGFTLLLIGGSLLSVGLALLCESNKKLKNLNDMLHDLELYNDGINHVPVAENMNLSTNGITLNSTLNAYDIDDDIVNYKIVDQPRYGTLKLGLDGNFSYTANNETNGTDYFTFMVNDGNLDSNTAKVTINSHIPPIANNMSITTRTNQSCGLIFNVTEPYNIQLNYSITSDPAHGTLNFTNNGNFTYTPYSNYVGNDSFTYYANDGFFNSGTATVNIVVHPDNPPIVNNIIVTTKKGKSVTKIFNITDIDGDRITILIVKPPMHGTVTVTGDKFVYTPSPNFLGRDFFMYIGNDGFLNSKVANVTIDIHK
jgi:hypothetical protein